MSKSITPLNNKGQTDGYWEVYSYGDLLYKRYYHNGNLIGYCEEYGYISHRLKSKEFNLI